MNVLELTQKEGIDAIKKYIKLKKGIDIEIKPPRNIRELNMFHMFAHYAYEQLNYNNR